MSSNLRIWRVVPTSETGVQAPTFIVETQENGLVKSEIQAIKIARGKSGLGRFENWNFLVERLTFRKDVFGRYVKYHQ